MPIYSELDLKVRVRVQNPQGADAVCARIARDIDTDANGKAVIGQTRLAGGGFAIPVLSMERADGNALGLEGEFEQYWEETHCDGDEGDPGVKIEMRAAFFYGVKFGRAGA